MCVCVYIFVCVYIYIYIYTHTDTHTHTQSCHGNTFFPCITARSGPLAPVCLFLSESLSPGWCECPAPDSPPYPPWRQLSAAVATAAGASALVLGDHAEVCGKLSL